jgi:hypothetical protein
MGRMAVLSRTSLGTNIFEKNWDLLIILDTCRPDALTQVACEYDFLNSSVGKIASVGASSPEWIAQTFTTKYMEKIKKTGYITSNAWSNRILEDGQRPEEKLLDGLYVPTDWDTTTADSLALFKPIWKNTRSEYEVADFPHADPMTMTDVTINIGRSTQDYNRLIVHYMQPHAPYLSNAINRGDKSLKYNEQNPFSYLLHGGDYDKVWRAYLTHLRWGLDAIEILLKNYDANRVIISADHGEMFGERGKYGHQSGLLDPHLRKVPWIEASASDEKNRNPEVEFKDSNASADEQLKALGYIE